MYFYLKIETKLKKLKKVIKILQAFEGKTSNKISVFKFIIEKNILKIKFNDDYNKLIYTMKWIDDIIDKNFRDWNSDDQLSILLSKNPNEFKNHHFKTGFKILFVNDNLIEALKNNSQIKELNIEKNNCNFKFEFYSKLEYGKTIKLETNLGVANFQVAKVSSHNLLFSLIWKGELKNNINVRSHYQCETSEIFGSVHCDCKEQLNIFLERMFSKAEGLLIYCHEEGRGLGLFNKINAYYETETKGLNTKKAMEVVAGRTEKRFFEIPADIIYQKGINKIKLWTNNPLKIRPFNYRNIDVIRKHHWTKKLSTKAIKYIDEKKTYMGHLWK